MLGEKLNTPFQINYLTIIIALEAIHSSAENRSGPSTHSVTGYLTVGIQQQQQPGGEEKEKEREGGGEE
jgi:hypothetical protein